MTTLQQLSDSWNALRNAALGRGVDPLVPPGLASSVGDNYEQFREWVAALGPFDAVRESVLTSEEALGWIEQYNALRLAVQAAGRPVPAALTASRGILGDVAHTVQSIALIVAVGAGVALMMRLRK